MKRYVSKATKWLAILTLICIAIFLAGVIFIIVDIPYIGLQIGSTMLGGLMSIIFVSCFFAEKSRALVIDDDKIVFPRGVTINGETVFKKTVVAINEICAIESKFYKGDKIISEDCFFHTLELKNGTKITVTLYAYGKEAEKEILEEIQKNIT